MRAIAAVRPRFVLVDRPDAPQSVIAVVREGVSASDPRARALDLVNTVLGGSFTSRLNQDLREEHGWSYGAGSSFQDCNRRCELSASGSRRWAYAARIIGEVGV